MKYIIIIIIIISYEFLVWLAVWVLWHINLCRLFNAKSIFMVIVLFEKKISLAWVHSLIVKKILIQTIQFIQTVLIQLI